MTHPVPFTPEQLKFLQTAYGINPLNDFVHVSDGLVRKSGTVWRKDPLGPKSVYCEKVWADMKKNPSNYAVNMPTGTFTYDE